MTRDIYNQRREALLAEAQQFLDDSDKDSFDAKVKDIEALDSQFENEAKLQANLEALKGSAFKQPENAAVNACGKAFASMGAETDPYDTPEYRNAFMNYVLKNIPIPAMFRNDAGPTKTGDVEVVIPTTTVQKIIERMDQTGNILRLVTQTNIKAGVAVPVSTLKPSASWVAEGAGSTKQKLTAGSITFGAYKLRCAVSMTFETEHMAYPMFERFYVKSVADAMVKAKETSIFKGTGSANGQPKGLLTETPEHTVEIAHNGSIGYADLLEAEAYELIPGSVWAMTKVTYMQHIMGILDDNGQPVARINADIDGKPEYTILGRRVEIVDPNYIASYAATVSADTVVAVLFNWSDYVFNNPVPMVTKKYYDEDTDDAVLKAVELCDGKCVQTQSLVVIKKKTNPSPG